MWLFVLLLYVGSTYGSIHLSFPSSWFGLWRCRSTLSASEDLEIMEFLSLCIWASVTKLSSDSGQLIVSSISCSDMAHAILRPDSLHLSAERYLDCKLLSAWPSFYLHTSYDPGIDRLLPLSPHRTAESGAEIVRPIRHTRKIPYVQFGSDRRIKSDCTAIMGE